MTIACTIARQIQDSSWIRRMFEEGIRLKAGRGAGKVFDFNLGNPDPEPPEAVTKALQKVVLENRKCSHAYMPNAGFPRGARDHGGTHVAGDGPALYRRAHPHDRGRRRCSQHAVQGDPRSRGRSNRAAPFFTEYRFYIGNHGGNMVPVETKEDFSLDLDRIAAALTPRTKAILLNSPNNPTGAIYPEESLRALEALLSRQAPTILVISDEPYKAIVYDGHRQPEVASLLSRTVIANSWSKQWAVPGERIGYLAISPNLPEARELAAACTFAHRVLGFVNAPAIWQLVAASVEDASVDVALYQEKKEILCGALARTGYVFTRPKGFFYIFPQTPMADDVAFIQMLQEEGILAVPGRGFGRAGHMRLSLTLPLEDIERSLPGFENAFRKAKG
ncbi:MAG: aminotransferase class I/II-fold pyridoxal phosphate-dependent enzyme [Opitutaceae bacterium]|nr:aminotransferase class I/II-fold pyridoxal phosphate-dependent enzyme [Opitutaceae bacterium]